MMTDVTIVIPTLNRPEYVIRTINYYCDNQYQGKIIFGDSSRPEVRDTIDRYIEQQSIGNVEVLNCEMLDLYETQHLLLSKVTTEYVVFAGDDDYIIPSSIERCVTFLEQHPDYAGATGRMVQFAIFEDESESGSCYGPVVYWGEYPTPSIEQETAADRIAYYASRYPVIAFSVFRTKCRAPFYDYQHVVEKDAPLLMEQSPNFRSLISGKLKSFPQLHVLRQIGAHQLSNPYFRENLSSTSLDWMLSPKFIESCRFLIDRISKELATMDYLAEPEAFGRTKVMIQEYCGRMLLHPMFWPEPEYLPWHRDCHELHQFYRSVSGMHDRTPPLSAKEASCNIHPIFHNPLIARDVDCYSIGNVFTDTEQFAALRTLVRMGWNVNVVHDWHYHFCMIHGVEPEHLPQFSTTMFDERYYLSNHDVTLEPGETPLQHFMLKGWRLGYNPNPLFDTSWYLEQHPDAAEPDINPLLHYLNNSYRGVQPHPCFNPLYYLDAHPDVLASGMDPYQHFLSYGAAEGRKAIPDQSNHEYARWLKRSKIVVCFSEQENLAVRYYGRHLEVLLCGALLCIEEGTPLTLPLIPMVEFVPFRSGQDLAEKVAYLLSHQAELDVIAARGQAAAERECLKHPALLS